MTSGFRVFFLLHCAWSALTRAADRRSKQEMGLSYTQHALLLVLLRQDGLPVTALAEALSMGKSSVTGLVDRMSANGLLRRASGAQDGRVVHVWLEDKGRALAESGVPLIRYYNEKLLAPFDAAERQTIQRFLDHIAQNADAIIDMPINQPEQNPVSKSG